MNSRVRAASIAAALSPWQAHLHWYLISGIQSFLSVITSATAAPYSVVYSVFPCNILTAAES